MATDHDRAVRRRNRDARSARTKTLADAVLTHVESDDEAQHDVRVERGRLRATVADAHAIRDDEISRERQADDSGENRLRVKRADHAIAIYVAVSSFRRQRCGPR